VLPAAPGPRGQDAAVPQQTQPSPGDGEKDGGERWRNPWQPWDLPRGRERLGSPGKRDSQRDLNFNSRQGESLFIRTCFIFRAGITAAVPVNPRVSKSSPGFTFPWLMRAVPGGRRSQTPSPEQGRQSGSPPFQLLLGAPAGHLLRDCCAWTRQIPVGTVRGALPGSAAPAAPGEVRGALSL